jgi:cell wall-associated NlpC family hydrolase
MRPHSFNTRTGSPSVRLALAALLTLLVVCAAVLATSGPAAATIAQKQEELADVRAQQADVQEELAASNEQINGLIAQVSEAREREAAAAAQLAEVEARLEEADDELAAGRAELERVRDELREAVAELEKVLVGIYKSDDPDMIKLLIESSGWEDASVDAAYLDRVHEYQADTVQRVEDLRDEVEDRVARLAETRERIAETRDEVAAQRDALADERAALEAQEAELAAARQARKDTLSRLTGREVELQDGIEAAQQRIARENAAPVPPAIDDGSDSDVAAPPVSAPAPGNGSTATLNSDGTATPPADAPPAVVAVIEAANEIHTKPYVWGGGHGSFESSGYDCSGAVSYALHGGGFLSSPLDSTGLSYWGEAGPGNWITVYANSGHTYAVIAGLRWDTSGTGGSGPGWSTSLDGYLDTSSYTARHPAGF